ncbi:MAG: hypothetical protein MUF38_20335, partial [Anaerolineae bacterium]|nr:hypothetical protein [Anaerolineae bacterium]
NLPYCQSPLGRPYAATDQRGIARPQFQYCDFGAFESNLLTLPPVNRSVNGSFEAAGATFNDADGWAGRNLNPDDYRRCDSTLTPVAAQTGDCVFMFYGPNANAEPRRLTQTLTGGGWSRAGKVLRLSAQVRTKNLGAGGRLAINVVYRDGTTGTALVRIPSGTNPYQRLMVRLPLAKRADSVTITVRLKTGGNQNARLWVDNVILVSQ